MSAARVTLSNGRCFQAEPGLSLLDAALSQGVVLEHGCRTGRCGTCRARVLAGESRRLHDESGLDAAAQADGWMLTCAREALTDMVLDIDDLSALADICAKTLPCRIDALERVAPDVMRVVLRLPPDAEFAFLPGQYVDVIAPGGLRRSYSIASSAVQTGRLEFHVKRYAGGAMGIYWFSQARPNDLLRFHGPLGTFFLRDVVGRDLVFLATGTGYAPIHSMLSQLALGDSDRPRSVRLIWGGRTCADLYANPRGVLPGLEFVPVLSRPDAVWDGARGHVQDVFLASGPTLHDAVCVYACGSDAMVQSARIALVAAGLSPKRYVADAFVSSAPAVSFR